MQPGELVVARLKGTVTIGRFTETTSQGQRVRISLGRNREAELPAERLLLATGITASGEEQVAEFRRRCEALAAEIDLAELWEVLRDEAAPVGLVDLAQLYWGGSPDVARRVALLLHLERSSLYFIHDKAGYRAQTHEHVQEVLTRRQRQEENAQAAASLMDHIRQGRLPPEVTPHQSQLVGHLRGYVIHGEDYTRSATARALLERLENRPHDLQRLAFELLRAAGVFAPDEPLELERAGIPEGFSKEALAEAATLALAPLLAEPRRRDLSAIPTVTIDDAETEDRDDALSLEVVSGLPRPVGDTSGVAGADAPKPWTSVQGTALSIDQTPMIYRIGIHIADAGGLVPAGGPIDQEADRRMATLYLPERKVPMLPPDVSSLKGSLVPGQRRVALSLLARVTESGEVLGWEVAPSVVLSHAALSYDQADQAMDEVDHPWHQTAASLHRIAQSLRRRRVEAGAVVVERPEMAIKVKASGEVDVRVLLRSTPARQMVAELMILCNSLLAEFCRREGLPAAYRTQALRPLADVPAEAPDGPLRRYMVMRQLAPAGLDLVPGAHRGLGVSAYIQATSPLRRYPDLVMQRQISHFLGTGKPQYSTQEMASVAQRAEVQLRELGRLEEERNRYWFLKYLKQSLDGPGRGDDSTLFQAVVLESQRGRPALLELADYPFRFRAELPEACAPGDAVTLRLHGVDLWRRVGHFVHQRPTS